jgi:hypothetical protein
MSGRRAQAGEGKVGCILWAIVVLIGGLIAFKAIPVNIASSELYDFMVEQAKWAGGTSPEVLEKRIIAKAFELKLPLDPKKCEVVRSGDNVRMRAQFTVPLEFPGYTYNWEFDLQIDRGIYIF